MSTSAVQAARLLALIPYLRGHQGITLQSAATAFGVTAAQIRKDLDVAWMCGLPGGLPGDLIEVDMDAVEGEGVIHLTNADYLDRPLRMTPDEAVSLMLAVRAVQEVTDSASVPAVGATLAKLETLAGEAADRVSVSLAAGAADIRAQLTAACLARRRLRLTYDGVSRGATTYPVVDPARVAVRDGFAYLDAWAHERGAWRTYRVDRVVQVDQTGEAVDEHGPPPATVGGWLDGRSEAVPVVLWVAPAASWVSEYYPTTSVVGAAGGGQLVTLSVADPAWLRGVLLRLGADVRVVEPADAGLSAAETAAESIAAYRAAGLAGPVG